MELKTSDTDPIRVDFCKLPDGIPSTLGMTFAPGKVKEFSSVSGNSYRRDVSTDLQTLSSVYKTHVLVSLMKDEEYKEVHIESLFDKVKEYNMEHLVYPIGDCHVPQNFEEFNVEVVDKIIDRLRNGKNVVVHCMGGLGRTGLVCACCLLKLSPSIPPDEVIKSIRSSRKGTIQTYQQVTFVREFIAKVTQLETRL